MDDEAKEKLVDLGYNPSMGARPLRRVIEEQIEDKVAEFYLENPEVGEIYVTVSDGEIVVTKSSEQEKMNIEIEVDGPEDEISNQDEHSDKDTKTLMTLIRRILISSFK